MSGKPFARWFLIIGVLMLVLRIGYKYYRSQQKPDYETQMESLEARNQALMKSIEADQAAQRTNGATVMVADSTVVMAADSATIAK